MNEEIRNENDGVSMCAHTTGVYVRNIIALVMKRNKQSEKKNIKRTELKSENKWNFPLFLFHTVLNRKQCEQWAATGIGKTKNRWNIELETSSERANEKEKKVNTKDIWRTHALPFINGLLRLSWIWTRFIMVCVYIFDGLFPTSSFSSVFIPLFNSTMSNSRSVSQWLWFCNVCDNTRTTNTEPSVCVCVNTSVLRSLQHNQKDVRPYFFFLFFFFTLRSFLHLCILIAEIKDAQCARRRFHRMTRKKRMNRK